MNLPFTPEQFLDMFARYHELFWPAPVILNLLALLMIYLVVRKQPAPAKWISTALAMLWLWSGIAYHWITFSTINPAAWIFGAMFVLQGLLFLNSGTRQSQLAYRYIPNATMISGALMIGFALIIYPVLGFWLGHTYPRVPTFGLPCPLTIFTFGLLLWTEKKTPFYLVIIPLVWSLIGFTAALKLGIYQDFALPLAALSGTALLWRKNRLGQSVKGNKGI